MIRKLFFLSVLPLGLFALEGDLPDHGVIPAPWFTGPLLAPSGNVIQAPHYNVEPYIYVFAYTGVYMNNWKTKSAKTLWSINPQIPLEFGITKWLDFQFTPSWFWNYRDSQANWAIGDFVMQFDFQLHQDQIPHKSWLPSVRFTLMESVPLGKYRNLNPDKLGTDVGGSGSWITTFQFVFSKLLHVTGRHFFNTRLALSLDVPAPVHVKGFNVYGGGYRTNETVYPGLNYEIDWAFEYNLTRNWAVACDFVGSWTATTTSDRRHVGTFDGDPIFSSRPANIRYSMAPAIEYNWNDDLGIIFGSWFTLAGKNTSKFSSIVIALNYFH